MGISQDSDDDLNHDHRDVVSERERLGLGVVKVVIAVLGYTRLRVLGYAVLGLTITLPNPSDQG